MMPDSTANAPVYLPPMRQDLRLHVAGNHADGSPSWTIQDPVSNQFYRIGWVEFEILSRWHYGDVEAIIDAVETQTPLEVSDEEVLAVKDFLLECQLLDIHHKDYTQSLLKRFRAAKTSRWRWLLQNYLFFRLPLLRPDRWLRAILPSMQWVYTWQTVAVVLALTFAGLVLTVQQWDVFQAHFVDALTFSEMMSFLIAIAVAKSLHELGHALTATRYGLRVAHMGVAFLVLWPVLYTDTGESWRLRDRKQRLAISSAGIVTELALAGVATFLWNITNDGAIKEALFYLATTSWLLSLSINASPFMRFDGYFILSDIVDFPNLHERSFAMARTAMRNRLLGWEDEYPEEFEAHKRHLLIWFAFGTWLYRFILFLAIAVLVYHFFFKLAGIILFAVELAWFIGRPIWNEIKVWKERSAEIKQNRKVGFGVFLGLALLYAAIPFHHDIETAAWVHSGSSHTLYSPIAARIQAMPQAGGIVSEQQTLFVLEQPQLQVEERIAGQNSAAIERQLAGLKGLRSGEDMRLQLSQQRMVYEAQRSAAQAEQQRLVLRAPFGGILTDLDPDLQPGSWVSPRRPLGTVYDPDQWVVEAFVSQEELARVEVGSEAYFYPSNQPMLRLRGVVTEIAATSVKILPSPMLSSRYGGGVPVLAESAGVQDAAMVPRQPLYKVVIQLSEAPATAATATGAALVQGIPSSLLEDMFNALLLVLIREASF